MKVLVLEHSRLYQKVLRELLEAQDCDVDCARSGEEGLENLRNKEYGLIIAGQHIFDDSSDEFISYYTALSNRCPVILLTSEPNEALPIYFQNQIWPIWRTAFAFSSEAKV
jgi:DNA-binding response OmpR family regulator